MKKKLYGWIFLIMFSVIIMVLPPPEGLTPLGLRAIALLVIAAFLWLGELLPVGASSLLIIVLAAMFGALETSKAFVSLSSDIIFLYIGGFIVAAAMSLFGLDKRIALWVINKTGTNKKKIVLGLMLGTALISAWMSSVVVVLALLPVVLGMLKVMGSKPGESDGKLFLFALMIAALTGGIATPVGTAPNALVMGFLRDMANIDISFVEWMYYGTPLAIVTTIVSWWLLVNFSYKLDNSTDDELKKYVIEEYKQLGPMQHKEKMTAISLILFAGLLFAVPIGKSIFGNAFWSEGTASIIACMFLFLTNTITWKQANNGIAWNILLLFAAGLTISSSLSATGAANYLATVIGTAVPGPALPVAFTIFGALFTQMTSNTATTAILAPIAISTAVVAGVNPMSVAIPVTLGISLGFLTPIGSALSPIVFGQMPDGNTWIGKASDYVKAGLVPFIVCLAITIIYAVYILPMLGFKGM
ncbi:MAG: DASS family sodium-coupled anion symporter [Clostridia bacterium]|jgi:sodium-dependent dicarboxylate transporter 2/3/5|nr:DASS family sodium-coupled anion symporter [Clostridia bacterium]